MHAFSLSKWAARHKAASQVVVTLLSLALLLIGFILGIMLYTDTNIDWRLLAFVSGLIYSVGHIAYQRAKQTSGMRQRYWKQRRALGIAYFAIGLGAIGMGVKFAPLVPIEPIPGITQDVSQAPLFHRVSQRSPEGFRNQRMFQRVTRQVLKPFTLFRKSTSKENLAGKIILYILVAATFMALHFLLFLLACSIACSGYGLMAFLVWLGGTFLFGLLPSLLYEWIFRIKTGKGKWISRFAHIVGIFAGFIAVVGIISGAIYLAVAISVLLSILSVGILLGIAILIGLQLYRRNQPTETENTPTDSPSPK